MIVVLGNNFDVVECQRTALLRVVVDAAVPVGDSIYVAAGGNVGRLDVVIGNTRRSGVDAQVAAGYAALVLAVVVESNGN